MKTLCRFITKHINKISEKMNRSLKSPQLDCICYGKVNYFALNGGCIEIDPSVVLNSEPVGYHVGMPFETTLIADKPDAYIKIGKNTRIHGSYIHAWKGVNIGSNVIIAGGTNIIDSNGHSTNVRYARFRRYFQDEAIEIIINDYVWIGMNCIILKGVEIGECSIVSAGSVVKESVPPFCLVEGNPARVVYTFDPNQALDKSFPIEKLQLEEGFYEY